MRAGALSEPLAGHSNALSGILDVMVYDRTSGSRGHVPNPTPPLL